jgi:hypothetical protein
MKIIGGAKAQHFPVNAFSSPDKMLTKYGVDIFSFGPSEMLHTYPSTK